MPIRRFCLALTFLTFYGFTGPGRAAASPYTGQARVFQQPDGSELEVLLYGTEFYLRATSTDDYTVVRDPASDWIVYAQRGENGTLVPSPIACHGVADPGLVSTLAALGIEPDLRQDPAVARALAERTKQRLWKGDVPPWATAFRSGSTLHAPQGGYTPTLGTGRGLVVLVDFPDRPGSIPVEEFDKAFNADTYDAQGSIRSWIETISYKKYSATHQVLGYMRAAFPTSHYAGGAEFDYSASAELMKQVFAYIDQEIDLTPFAENGYLPSLVVIYAGSEIAKVWATGLWPHAGEGGYTTSEKVRIPNAFISNAGSGGSLDLGTYRHELGHSLFGWPDTYDYDNDSKSAGGYATETTTPCAPFRLWAGWITVVDLVGKNTRYSLPANGDTCLRYRNVDNPKEYFVVEYMRKDPAQRRDAPDEGLLVWHVDEGGDNSRQDMTATKHYELSVEQADGLFDLERNRNGRANDLFHAGNKDKFDETTTPNSRWWDGSSSGLRLCEIGPLDPSMRVTVGCDGELSPSTGGALATGGVVQTGGSVATGGVVGTGGAQGSGGQRDVGDAAIGGMALLDGAAQTGGTGLGDVSPSTGGEPMGGHSELDAGSATGGARTGDYPTTSGYPITSGYPTTRGTPTGGAPATVLPSSSGCSLGIGRRAGAPRSATFLWLGLPGLGLVIRWRFRRRH